MFFFGNRFLKRYFKTQITYFFIVTGLLIICTLIMSEFNIPVNSDYNQQTSPKVDSSVLELANSDPKHEPSISLDRQYTSNPVNTTGLTFTNITTPINNPQVGLIKLVIDSSGNMYVLGNILNQTNYYLTTSLLLLKYSPDGNQLWNRTWGKANEIGTNIIMDSQDYLYTLDHIRGIYNSSVLFKV